jgi:hypothetical protein
VAKGYKAIYHLTPQPDSFNAAGCLKADDFRRNHFSPVARVFGFNETDRRNKLFLINFNTVERQRR